MAERSSPHQSPTTATIRRNPHRSARPTASKTAIKPPPLSSTKTLNPPNFPLNDILSIDIKENPKISPPKPPISSNSLNVFLRIRPLPIIPSKLNSIKVKKVPKSCLVVNDLHSVTVLPSNCDSTRLKSEEYNGFSHVFGFDSSQDEVYEKMMRPMVEEFLNGRSGLLAALGPSGSGKTHTVFGSSKEPGLVPRVLHHIFSLDSGDPSLVSRSFYLSIFEIHSEKGKGEKLLDLSPDGSDIYMQQSVVKGLKENPIKDIAEAESLIAHAKLKRATALTNSNSQSSRSQCIISIRCENKGECESLPGDTLLTFVDLAGAEREKKTGNKGGRLLESNFINNTSMVFGLCLRSLLEHQKNPKKPLQKHFQSSLLTRYLRDYLEGRKRMALILTVRSSEEDYFDASFLLRQASPYMEIKFRDLEETTEMPRNKRRLQTTGNVQHKRAKLSGPESRVGMTTRDSESLKKEDVESIGILGGNKINVTQVGSRLEVDCTDFNLKRQYYVMQGFAKALWVVLKQYKERVKVMQKDIDILTENLKIGHAQYMVMEKELLNLKSQCSCPKQGFCDFSTPAVGCQITDSEGRVTENSDFKEAIRSGPIRDGSLVFNVPGSANVSQVHLEDLPSGSTSSISVVESIDPNAILTSPFHNTNLSSTDVQMSTPQSYQAQQTPMDFQISHGIRKNNSHDKDQRKGFIKESTDAAAHLLSSSVMGLFDQGKSCGSASPNKMDMENVSSGLGSNFNSKLETKEPNQSKPSTFSDAASHLPSSSGLGLLDHDKSCGSSPSEIDKENVSSGLGSNVNSELKTKETSHSKPSSTLTQNEVKNVANGPGRILDSELETKEIPHSKPSKAERPKRKLMPASSLLLKDAGNIDVTEENVNFRGRGARKLVGDEHKRSKGNASLMRLLKNHLPR